MFYFPGSWHIGTTLQWFLNLWICLEFWPLTYVEPMDWDDSERRGAGSLVILLLLVTGIVLAVLWLTGVI